MVNCRWDFHQTATHVYVSIYAKQYCPRESVVQLNPIRLIAKLIFPQQSNASFILDVELRGVRLLLFIDGIYLFDKFVIDNRRQTKRSIHVWN